MVKFATGNKAYGISDRSGFRYRLKDMKKEWNGLLVGPDEFEPKHPQLFTRKKVIDPQALRNARPEISEEESKILLEFDPFFASSVDSNVLTVIEPGHGRTSGDRVRFSNAQSFQDFFANTLNRNEGFVITVTSTDEYTITVQAVTEATVNTATTQYDNMVSVGILAASVSINTDNQMTLFQNNEAISGRPLGDITGDNNLSVRDSLAYLNWNSGLNSDSAQIQYIQDTMNVYMFNNFSSYKKYLQKSTIANSRGGGGNVSVETLTNNAGNVTVAGSGATTSVGTITINIGATETSVSGVGATLSVGNTSVTTNLTIYTVTVGTYGGGNKYYIDGQLTPTLNLSEGTTYRFDQSDSTNGGHPIRFSTTSDGTHGGGSEYTTGVTTNGTPGSSGAYTQITVASSAPTLYYYCTNHSGMGGQANTP